VNKQVKKKVDRKCWFCPCDDYESLSVHRIIPGSEGGKYTESNTISICENHHRLVHSGRIKILGKYFSSGGRYVLHYIQDNEEKWG
jgi:hypothetical protein